MSSFEDHIEKLESDIEISTGKTSELESENVEILEQLEKMTLSMTTEKENRAKDLFARQGLIGGKKVPVLWSLSSGVSKILHDKAM